MKKSRLKLAVKNAMKNYYKTGMTNTANSVYLEIIKNIEIAYQSKHKWKHITHGYLLEYKHGEVHPL